MTGCGVKCPSLLNKGMNETMRSHGAGGPASPAIFIHSRIAGYARRYADLQQDFLNLNDISMRT